MDTTSISGRQKVQDFLALTTRTLTAIDPDAVEAAIQVLLDAWRDRRTVYVMGNGGSASTASHFACDLAKYTIAPGRPRFRVIGLTDNVPLVSAWTNDGGFGSIYEEQMEPWLEAGDVLVGFSVHGGSGSGDAGPWSQNLVRAMRAAQARGARVVGFSGFDGGAMAETADVCITVPALEPELGTPVVESVHVALHHLVVHELRERVRGA